MRAGRRWRVALALLGAAQVVLGLPAGTSATAGIDRGEAGGEAYALLARGIGGTLTPAGPGVVGPMAPVEARVPPTATVTRRTQTVGCDHTGTAACPAPELRSLRVADDAVVATLEGGRHACPAQSGGAAGAIDRALAPPAAAACDTIAHLDLGLGAVELVADSVVSRSTAQGCNRLAGDAGVGTLRVAGIPVVEGTPPTVPLTPNRTVVIPAGATGAAVLAFAVFDEQIPDPGGGGLTVNAIHLRGGPALGAAAGLDVVIGHTHSRAVCPRLVLQREAVPGGEVTFAVVDPAVFPVDAAVVADGAPGCFAGDRRGGGCMEPIADMVARHHALLGLTANYTDWVHVLGAAVVDHRVWGPVDAHTTSLCVADATDPGQRLVTVVKTADPARCRAVVSGQRVVTAGRSDVEGLSDAGHHERFWWSTRPPVAEPRALVGVLADGSVLIALATATRSGVPGGISQPDAVRWLIDHDVVDGIEMDGGNQGDMVVAGGAHVVPLGDGVPRLQVALLLDPPGSEVAPAGR